MDARQERVDSLPMDPAANWLAPLRNVVGRALTVLHLLDDAYGLDLEEEEKCFLHKEQKFRVAGMSESLHLLITVPATRY